MMNGNGVLYEDLAHARPRPPIAPPSIEVRKAKSLHYVPNNIPTEHTKNAMIIALSQWNT